ncbi:MAG: ATP-binding protein [Granulosicoccaceae bacterium]|jgi:two-component system sensor histidine kinase BarA
MKLRLNDWGITARVFFLALVPVILVTFVLGFYIINSRTEDLVNEISNKGQVIASSLASASEFGVVTENVNSLHRIVQSVRRDADVIRIAIYDARNQAIYVSDKGLTADETATYFPQEFIANIYRSDLAPDEFTEPGWGEHVIPEPRTIGYVKVTLSGMPFVDRQNTIIRNSLVISLVGLLLSLLLAILISRGVTMPIKHLMTAVSFLRKGVYSTRISRKTGGELGELQDGINNMAEEIEASHKNLEQRVEKAVRRYKESISELQNKNYDLQIARRAAMRAGEVKSEFLANMSHEIRTPLNAIIGFSRRLKKTAVSHEQVEYAHTVTSAANQLRSVIDDILNFSKLESGKMDIKPVDIDLRYVLEDVIAMMSGAAHEKKLELVLLVDSDVPQAIRVDPDRLRQILTNLVNNAIKFTDAGDVVVHVSMSASHHSASMIRLAVTDSGVGIDEQEQAKLFKPFTQADMSSTRRFSGTGLGLVVCKRIIDMMNGNIWLKSKKGAGTTFYVDIPLDHRTPIDDAGDDALAGYSALLFDPHLYSRRALRNSLVHMGVNTYTAASQQTLESMLSGDDSDAYYDVLIISMPASEDSSNISTRILPIVKKYYHGPLFILTSDEEYTASCLASHESRTVIALKPVRNESLRQELLKIFGLNIPREIEHETGQSIQDKLQGMTRLLVAEDNDFNRLYITRLLEDHGITADCAVNGQQAVDMALHNSYDMILMDVHMPVMDGIEAASRIRQELVDNPPVIVAVTADVFANKNMELLENGFSECLLKPIDEEMLIDTISNVGVHDVPFVTDNTVPAVAGGGKGSTLLDDVRHIPSDLLEKLVQELPEHVAAIQYHLEQSDIKALRDRLHMFLGVCSYFGITDLERSIRALQLAARNDDLTHADAKIKYINSIIQRLEKEWHAEIARQDTINA